MPKVAAVVPIHNGREETLIFLESLTAVTYPGLTVVVVDDGSTDGSADAIVERFPQVTLIKGDGNLWWSGATNLGIRQALRQGIDYILTINNDNVVAPGFLEPLVAAAQSHPRSMVTAKMHAFEEQTHICSFGGIIDWRLGEIRDRNNRRDNGGFDRLSDCDWLHGGSTLIPAAAFTEIGFFDSDNCPQYQGDTEFSLRAKKHGYRLLAEPQSIVYNKTTVSTGTEALDKNSITALLTRFNSPFYFRANYFLYRNYCPCRPVQLFLVIRYLRLLYSIFRRRFIDRTRRNVQK